MIERSSIRKFEFGDLPRLHEIRKAAYEPVFQSFQGIVGETIAPIAIASAEREQSDYLDAVCGRGLIATSTWSSMTPRSLLSVQWPSIKRPRWARLV